MTVGGVRKWRRSARTQGCVLDNCAFRLIVELMFCGNR